MQSADKVGLRAEFSARRRLTSAAQLEVARAQVRAHVLRRRAWSAVAAYLPMRTEPGSTQLLDELHRRGVRVIVPIVLADRDLDWASYPAGEVLGVEAIATVDAVLVPALAVARDGTRLGRGGGSYDRALRRVRSGVPLIALLFDTELVDALPHDRWDVAVSAAVTPSGWHTIGESGTGQQG